MICIDMKAPSRCIGCPFVRLITEGYYDGSWMCKVIEHQNPGSGLGHSIVNISADRDDRCPLMEIEEAN